MSGVTRRRVAGGGTSSTTEANGATSADISYAPSTPSEERKIAYDPKDLEDDKDKKEPKLTLMEEVLLLGLKDRQVSDTPILVWNVHDVAFRAPKVSIAERLIKHLH